MKVTILTCADSKYRDSQNSLKIILDRIESNLKNHDISQRHVDLDEEFVGSEFYNANIEIASSPVHFGYCIWKPHFIKKVIEEEMSDNRVVLYIDSADSLNESTVLHIIHFFENNLEAKISAWHSRKSSNRVSFCTKRECLISMDKDIDLYKNAPMIEAGFLSFRCNYETLKIVDEWQSFCLKKECIMTDIFTEVENYPEYRVNRADQSILSILFKKHDLSIFLQDLPGLIFDFYKYKRTYQ